MHNELVRDRIVVGIKDSKLSEKLQMEPELTLETVVTLARQSESVKKQQPEIRGPTMTVEVTQLAPETTDKHTHWAATEKPDMHQVWEVTAPH